MSDNVVVLPGSGPTEREQQAYREFRDLLTQIDMGARFLIMSNRPEYQAEFKAVNEERLEELVTRWYDIVQAVAARP